MLRLLRVGGRANAFLFIFGDYFSRGGAINYRQRKSYNFS